MATGRDSDGRVPAWRPTTRIRPAESHPDRYRYDPLDPVNETVGANCWALCTALVDRRRHDGRTDILWNTSEPVARDMEITGPIRTTIHAASSAPDTDFTVTLCHVLRDGAVNTIQDGIVRARYRNGPDHPTPLDPGRVVAYPIDLYATSYLVAAGDRIRLDVSSSAFDRYDRNLNTIDPVGLATTAVVADQAVYHSPAHPGCVVVPVIGG